MDETDEFEKPVVTGLGSSLPPSLWARVSPAARGALPEVLGPSHPYPLLRDGATHWQ